MRTLEMLSIDLITPTHELAPDALISVNGKGHIVHAGYPSTRTTVCGSWIGTYGAENRSDEFVTCERCVNILTTTRAYYQ